MWGNVGAGGNLCAPEWRLTNRISTLLNLSQGSLFGPLEGASCAMNREIC